MTLKIPIYGCEDEWSPEPHWITFTDDGEIHLDSDLHDVELELSLVALGAPAPRCIWGYTAYQKNPFGLLVEALKLIATESDMAGEGILKSVCDMLALDFLEQLKPLAGPPEFDIAIALSEILSLGRARSVARLRVALGDTSVGTASAVRKWSSHNKDRLQKEIAFASDAGFVEQARECNGTRIMVAYVAKDVGKYITRSTGFPPTSGLRDVSIKCMQAVAQPIIDAGARIPNDEYTHALEAERSWQKSHMVKAISAILERKPWPSV